VWAKHRRGSPAPRVEQQLLAVLAMWSSPRITWLIAMAASSTTTTQVVEGIADVRCRGRAGNRRMSSPPAEVVAAPGISPRPTRFTQADRGAGRTMRKRITASRPSAGRLPAGQAA